MKNFIFIIVLFFSFKIQAESITVSPFSLEMYKTQAHLDIDVKLTLICRYQPWIISDSAEFIYKTLRVSLKRFNEEVGNVTRIIYRLDNYQKLELSGVFKLSKECKPEFEFHFIDKKYVISNSSRKRIEFPYWSKVKFAAGDSVFDHLGALSEYEKRTFELRYEPMIYNVKVALFVDGARLKTVPVEKNPDTNLPFEISQLLN